jgi:CheY-like chemotaxis protein
MASILVVEDELEKPVEDNLFVEILEAEGHSIAFAETGDEAIEHLSAKQFDVILLDIMVLPTIDSIIEHKELQDVSRPDVGVILLEMIKTGAFSGTGVSPNVPVLIISAVTGDSRWKIIKKLVADEYILRKPCSPELIVDKVHEILSGI